MKNEILIYEIDAPKAGNAFGAKQAEEIIKLLSPIAKAKDKPAAFVLQASGRFFCTGGNLSDYASMKTPAVGRDVNRKISKALAMISELDIPTLCLVQGDCWGGGIEVLSAFDHVIAAPEVSFGFWQRRIGLTFGWGGGTRLLQRLSARRLLGLSLQTRAIGAHEALQAGLIDEAVLASRFSRATSAWLSRVNDHSQLPVPYFKKMLGRAASLNEKIEAVTFQKLWWNRDHLAALRSRKS